MSLLNRIFLGHRIDAWTSDYTLIAARTLNQVAADLIAETEHDIGEAGLRDSLFNKTTFIQDKVAPRLRAAAEPVAQEILREANSALLTIVEEQAVWIRGPDHPPPQEDVFDGAKDIAAAAGPLAAGVAAAATLPAAAITTTSAVFGLVTTTTISWPLMVGGGALAGAAVMTGLVNTAKLRDRSRNRLRASVRKFIISSLMKGETQGSSLLEQLVAEFERAADRAKAL